MTGAKGVAPSHDYKVNTTRTGAVLSGFSRVNAALTSPLSQVCATYMDGFRATAVCPVGGPRAAEKARRTAESIITR